MVKNPRTVLFIKMVEEEWGSASRKVEIPVLRPSFIVKCCVRGRKSAAVKRKAVYVTPPGMLAVYRIA